MPSESATAKPKLPSVVGRQDDQQKADADRVHHHRHDNGDDDASSAKTTASLSVVVPTPKDASNPKKTAARHHHHNHDDEGGLVKHSQEATSASNKAPPPAAEVPDVIVFRKSPDGDDFGFRAVLETITNPQMFSWARFAFRVVAFISFPMFTIAIHPNTMFKLGFPHMLIASVIATSTARPSLGEQIGLHSWTWRGVTFMLVLGTVFDSWSISKHVDAWWGLIAVGIFLAGLCTHGGMRRFLFLYYFVYMMELRMFELYFGAVPTNNASWMAADFFLGTFFGIAATLFPYPVLTSTLTDMLIGRIFEGMSKMLMGMQSFLVSPAVHAAVVFYGDASPFQKIEHVLGLMAPLLWFTNWEPWEFPTRNPVRRLKLSLFRRILSLMYAAFSVGHQVAVMRRDLADRVDAQRIRMEIWLQVHQGTGGPPGDARERAQAAASSQNKFFASMRETFGEDRAVEVEETLKALRANTNEHYSAFTTALTQAIVFVGKAANKPESFVKETPFQTLAEREVEFQRNRRLEVLQMLHLQSRLVAARRRRSEDQRGKGQQPHPQPQQRELARGARNVNAPSTAGDTSASRYTMGREDALEILDYQDVIDDMDVYLAFQEMFFAMLLSMIAGELVSFGETMGEYKPEKSLCRRLLVFLLIEPWNDFWSALWSLLHLDTPSDVRTVKDAVKMTCAFLAACAFNFELWTPTGGTYFFGTTILLGLPVEEETIGIGVCRMAGNTLGCALGYLAYHNTKNLSEMIGLIMCLSFVCHLGRNHPVFGQCFFYAGFIAMAGMVTSLNTLELLVRVLASTYTVMAYALCCIFVFPTNPVKILWGYRMKVSKAISETIDDVAVTARLPLLCRSQTDGNRTAHRPYGLGSHPDNDAEGGGGGGGAEDDDLLSMTLRSVGHNDNGVDHMLAELNVQLGLVDRLMAMCVKWTPIAESYPLMRGMLPYPKLASLQVHGAHLKMVASLRLLVFGVQLIHRPRSDLADPALQRLLSGSVADFLDDFSDAVRLIFQSFIDSLQASRTWSYSASLVFHGILMKLRVRLHAILFEAFVLIGIPTGRSTLDMDGNDLRSLQRDTNQQMHAAGRGGDSELARSGGVRVGDTAAPQGGATAPTPPSPESDANASQSLSFVVNPNDSFAGRYLLARRALGEGQHPESVGGPAPRTMEEVKQSAAFNNTMNNLSIALGDSQCAYQHRARLRKAEAAPQDMFPFQPEDPSRGLGLASHRGREEQREGREYDSDPTGRRGKRGDHTPPSPRNNNNNNSNDRPRADDVARQPDYDASKGRFTSVHPPKPSASKSNTVMSRLMRPHNSLDRAVPVPRYEGPSFSYREDILDMPVDTDFLALVAILSSCGSFMDEVQSLSGPVNNISGYQKQLHESSLCLKLLDRLSDCAKETRKANYERYHYPPPPSEKRTHLNAQVDVWRDWRF